MAPRAASPGMGGEGCHGACSRRPSVGLSTLLPVCGDGPALPPGGHLRLSKPRAYIVGIFLPVESPLPGHVQLTCGPRGQRCWGVPLRSGLPNRVGVMGSSSESRSWMYENRNSGRREEPGSAAGQTPQEARRATCRTPVQIRRSLCTCSAAQDMRFPGTVGPESHTLGRTFVLAGDAPF